jgi:hypothetical protein
MFLEVRKMLVLRVPGSAQPLPLEQLVLIFDQKSLHIRGRLPGIFR